MRKACTFKKENLFEHLTLLIEIETMIARWFWLSEISVLYLLWWCDALLFIELCVLFGFTVQTEALFKGLLLQH